MPTRAQDSGVVDKDVDAALLLDDGPHDILDVIVTHNVQHKSLDVMS